MARRVTRRNEHELLIHKGWFNGLLGLALLIAASVLMALARNSHSPAEHIAAIILAVGGLNRALRFATDR